MHDDLWEDDYMVKALRKHTRPAVGLYDQPNPVEEGARLHMDVTFAGYPVDDRRQIKRSGQLAYVIAYLEIRGWRVDVHGETLKVQATRGAANLLVAEGRAEEAGRDGSAREKASHEDEGLEKAELFTAPGLRRE